jgi:hypothetical protein
MKKGLFLLLVLIPIRLFSVDLKASVSSGFDVQTINNSSQLFPTNFYKSEGFDFYIISSLVVKSDFGGNCKGFINLVDIYYPKTFTTNTPQETLMIKDVYIDVMNDVFSLRLGKQFIKWGSSVFFYPIDVVNIRKDPLSYTGFDEGKPSIDLSIPIQDFCSLSFISVVDSLRTTNITDLPIIAKFSLFLNEFDMFLFSEYQQNYRPIYGMDLDYTFSLGDNWSFKTYSELGLKWDTGRQMIIMTNGAYTLDTMTNNIFFTGVIGGSASYSFNSTTFIDGITFLFELYYNDENWNKQNFQDYLSYLGQLSLDNYNNSIGYFETFKNSKTYLYLAGNLTGLFVKDLNLTCGCVLNVEDFSSVLSSSLDYKINSNTSAQLNAQFYLGNNSSEFGNLTQKNLFNCSLSIYF